MDLEVLERISAEGWESSDQVKCWPRVRHKPFFFTNLTFLAEEDTNVSVTDKKHNLTLHKVIIRHGSNALYTHRDINMFKVVLAANLKTYLVENHILPKKYMQEFEMEVVQDLLIYVENWMKHREAIMGKIRFKVWVNKEIIKLEGLNLFEDPESVRCAEVLQLLREEPTFRSKMTAVQQGHNIQNAQDAAGHL